jgi:hypothetical protein
MNLFDQTGELVHLMILIKDFYEELNQV